MSPDSPPTNAEVMRRLSDVTQRLDRLVVNLEEGYVRKDVSEQAERTRDVQIAGLEDEIRGVYRRFDTNDEKMRQAEDNTRANRRLIVASFLAPVLTGVIIALILSVIHR